MKVHCTKCDRTSDVPDYRRMTCPHCGGACRRIGDPRGWSNVVRVAQAEEAGREREPWKVEPET